MFGHDRLSSFPSFLREPLLALLLVLLVLLRLEQSWCGILQRGFDPRAVRLLLLRGDLDLSLLLSLLALGPRLILAFPLGPPLAVPLPVAMIPVAVEPIHVRPAAHPVSVPPVPSIPPRAMVPVPVPVPVPVVITVPAAFAAGVPGPARVPVVPAPIARIIPAPLAVPVVVTRAVPILALGLGYRVDLTLLVGARVGWSHLTSPARLCLDREWSAQIIRPAPRSNTPVITPKVPTSVTHTLRRSSRKMGGPPFQVFVGNVPYDATEERLRDMFSEVGPVHDFR